MENVIRVAAPCFIFHPKEQYMPQTWDTYLKGCSLWHESKEVLTDCTNVLLDQQLQMHPEWIHGDLRLDPYKRSSIICGRKPDKNMPLWVHVVETKDYYYIQYITFYGYNGALPLSYTGGWFSCGAHEADVEHVTALVKKPGLSVEGYYLSHHGEETFYPCHQLKRDAESQHYKIWVARHSHAHYATAGTFKHYHGMTYDECDHGMRWLPRKFQVLSLPGEKGYTPETMGFLRLRGYIGHIHNLMLKTWFVKGIKNI